MFKNGQMYSWKDRITRLAAAVPASNGRQFARSWRTLGYLVLAACSLTAPAARAVTIPVALGPPGVRSSPAGTVFDQLNGISLNSQTLSLDFVFANSQFVRVFTATPTWSVLVSLQTNDTDPGFLSGTGFLFDNHQIGIGSARNLGSANGDPGEMNVGLFPLLDDNGNPSNLPRPFDHYGVHLDLTLPFNPSVEITGGEFMLSSDGVFGVGPGRRLPRDIVPDSSATIVLFAIASCGLLALRIWANPRRVNAFPTND